MDELKNLMIQTLEANGILGQLRAQIRCSVFKIIDNQDDMENPAKRAKSSLHWENPKARDCLTQNGVMSVLLAELIREYLDFYQLDYSKQIFLPETNLTTVNSSDNDKLVEDSKLNKHGPVDEKKPLLLQILEKFVKGEVGQGGFNQSSGGIYDQKSDPKSSNMKAKNMSQSNSPDQQSDGFNMKSSAAKQSNQGGILQFSDDKNDNSQTALGIGEGILGKASFDPVNKKTESHIEKANSLLDELSREEKSGFKAEIASGGISGSQKNQSELSGLEKMDKVSDKSDRPNKFNNAAKTNNDGLKKKKSSPEIDDNYDEDFEEIDEDLPVRDDDLENSQDRIQAKQIGDSHGITVSQSLGIDPSVDSLALEDYDHIETVEIVQQKQ